MARNKNNKELVNIVITEMVAARHNVRDARLLQTLVPEIAEDYRNGKTLMEISDDYQVYELFNLTPEESPNAGRLIVYFAIVGNKYSIYGETYAGLIPLDEALEIGKQHRAVASSKTGTRLVEEGRGLFGLDDIAKKTIASRGGTSSRDKGVGIFGLSATERHNNAKRAGSISGAKHKANGVGVCGMTQKERIASGRKSAESRGMTVYDDDEVIAAYLMFENPKFLNPNGTRNLRLGAEYHNKIFFPDSPKPVRSNNDLNNLLNRKREFMSGVTEKDKHRVQETYLANIFKMVG
jgi:hypothetical protein